MNPKKATGPLNIRVIPRLFAIDNGGSGFSFHLLGAEAGARNLHFHLGDDHKSISFKRDGTLLDASDLLDGLPIAGSTILAQSLGLNTSLLTTDWTPTNHWCYYVMMNIPLAATVTGIKFLPTQPGDFTTGAGDHNMVALYSYDATIGVGTRVAISGENTAMWKGGGQVQEQPFETPVLVSAGIYFGSFVYGYTTQAVAPKIAVAPNVVTSACSDIDLPNQGKTYGRDLLNSSPPETITMSAHVTQVPHRPWIAVY